MNKKNKIQVYKINDCDWYAGASFDECLKLCNQDTGEDWTEDADPEPLSDDDLIHHTYHNDDQTISTFKTALEVMIVDKQKFPCAFASTEY